MTKQSTYTWLPYLLAGIAAVAALAGLIGLLSIRPAVDLHVSLPGNDGRPEGWKPKEEIVDLSGTFETFDGVASTLPGFWPRFRGADFDNICKDSTALADSWGEAGPEMLWSVTMGEGHAAPVIMNGKVYVIDYDEEKHSDAIRCFSLEDGKEIWRRSYSLSVKRNHGMSRTIPAITENYLVTIGPRCHVVCLDPETGDYRWGIDLQKEYGTTEPLWYTGQCPLIDGDVLILAPGGPDALLMAVDLATGEVRWKCPNPDGLIMSHASILPMTFRGEKQYLYTAMGQVVGVSTEGKLLWTAPFQGRVIAPSPLALDDGKIFVTAGYGAGGMMLQLHKENGEYRAEMLFKTTPKDGLACEQQTPIYHGGLLYGIMPKDAGALKGQFVCYRPDGELVFSSGPEHRYGLGPFILVDDKFYILRDDGLLTMAKLSTTAFEVLDQAQVIEKGGDAWGPIAPAGDRMLLRDATRLVCIAVGKAAS